MKNKKAISGVITAIIMIALVMAAGTIVWSVVNNIIRDKLDEASSCFDVFEKVAINNDYTCFNSTSKDLQISIGVGEIDITELLIAVSGSGDSKSFKLSKEPLNNGYVFSYPDRDPDVILPNKNSGRTYLFDTQEAGVSTPSGISVAPIVGSNQCEVSDSLQEIDDCRALIF